MKSFYLAALMVVAALAYVALPHTQAYAQTACPVGTAAGSATCGPDGGGYIIESSNLKKHKESGVASFAFDTETAQVYGVDLHGFPLEFVTRSAINRCSRRGHTSGGMVPVDTGPPAECVTLLAWSDACAAAAIGEIGGKQFLYAETGKRAASAKKATMAACNAAARNCTIAHEPVCAKNKIVMK